MAQQTIKWTALPNGQADGTLRLSVFVTPTLTAVGDATLEGFPDFLDWPARMAAARFRVRFGGAAPLEATRVSPDPDPLDSGLWTAIFRPSTLVKSALPPLRLSDRIGSFSVRDVTASIEDLVSAVGLDSPTEPPLLRADEGLTRARLDRPLRRVDRSLAAGAATEKKASSPRLDSALRLREGLRRVAPGDAGPSVGSVSAVERRTDIRLAADARLDVARVSAEFSRARRFHMPVLEGKPPRLGAKDLIAALKRIDFHEIVSALGRYPRLLRRLGLVVDLEVPAAGVPANSVVAVEVDWTPSVATDQAFPWTRCRTGGPQGFAAAPRDADAGDLADGMLKLGDPDRFDLIQIDVDSAAMQVMAQQGEGEDAPVPSLRSTGLAVAKVDRAAYLALTLNRQFSLENLVLVSAAATGAGAPPPLAAPEVLYAADLVRGYRMDIRDEETGVWHSLCRRVGTYRVAGHSGDLRLEDEGWASSAVTKPSGPDSDEVLVHEILFRWEGWSLVAPRPGKPVQAEGVPDGDVRFGLDVAFAPPEGSLPRLRFGKEYRVRARAVDLAGNGVPYTSGDDSQASEVERYSRHEPVAAPVLTPRESLLPKPGESLERLVIRSYNDAPAKDATQCKEQAERHVAPPRVSQQMAEQHGMFDGPNGLRGDAATWKMLLDHDEIPPEVDPAEQQKLVYLPDPLAYGAALRYVPPPNAKPRTGETYTFRPPAGTVLQIRTPYGTDANLLHIPFRGSWPERQPFRIRIFEPTDGADQPYFEEAKRILHVPLEKGEMAEMWVSCYPEPAESTPHGLWRMMAADVARASLARARKPLSSVRQLTAKMGRAYAVDDWSREARLEPEEVARLETLGVHLSAGLHWMVTPYRKLTLVHATQQPLVAPDLVATKIGILRGYGSTWASIDHDGPIAISGRSTAKVAIRAEWTDLFDTGEDDDQPRKLQARAVLPDRMVEPTDSEFTVSGRQTRQNFGDTRHRLVTYTAVATSRFREYFDVSRIDAGQLEITRGGTPAAVHVPSTARPPAPRVHSVLPAFGWQRIGAAASPAPPSTVAPGAAKPPIGGATAVGRQRAVRPPRDIRMPAGIATASRREGGGLRVYLERPWFASGEDEMLGVVLATPRADGGRNRNVGVAPSPAPITRWGSDPLWVGAPIEGLPAPEDFLLATDGAEGLATAEDPEGPTVSVVGHPVAYDPVRRLWFADIQVDTHGAYWPFIRLALARFQPYSIAGVHLSPIVVADFAQLPPERYATIGLDAKDAAKVTVSVSGPTYRHQTLTSRMEVTVEQRSAAGGDLGWIPAADEPVVLENAGKGTEGSWSGTVTLPAARTARPFRLVVREYEVLLADGAPEHTAPTIAAVGPLDSHPEPRLVYADVLPVEG